MPSFLKREANTNSDYRNAFGKRPLFFAAVFFLVGILMASLFEMQVYAAFAAVAVFLLLHILTRHERFTGLLILIAVMFVGVGLFSLRMQSIDGEHFSSGEVELTGRIREINIHEDGKATYKLSGVSVQEEGLKNSVFVSGDYSSDFRLDDILKCTGEIRRPTRRGYEFGFDDRLYCAANGVSLRMTAEYIKRDGRAEDALSKVDSIREHVGERMNELFRDASPIARAMLIGMDESIDAETIENYRSAGISHVLCISGLHLGVMCYSVFLLFDKLKSTSWIRFMVCMMILLCYTALAGFKLSIMRSAIMFAMFLLFSTLPGRYDALTSLATAFLALALANPAVVFDAGFQLSFGAVFSIMCLSQKIFPKAQKKSGLLAAFAASCAAFFGTSLILIDLNNEINFTALLVSPLSVLLAGVLVPVIAVITLIYCVFGGFTVLLGNVGIYFISLMNDLAIISQRIELVTSVPAVYGVAVIAGFAAVFICSKYMLVRPGVKVAACLAMLLLIPGCLYISSYKNEGLRIDILDDKYANAAVITTDEGSCVLIDAGNKNAWGYLEDYGLEPSMVFITADRAKSTGGIELFSDAEMFAPASLTDTEVTEKYLGYSLSPLYGGESFVIDGRTVITAVAGKDAKRMSYIVSRDGKERFIYLAEAPIYNGERAEAAFFNSVTKGLPEYLAKSGVKYAIIKSADGADTRGVRYIETERAGVVTVFVDGEIKVKGTNAGTGFFS